MIGNKPLIFATSGCFLFFHEGHKELIDYTIEVAKGNPIIIAVNSENYLLEKHSEKIKNIDSKLNTTELSADYRANKVKEYLKDKGQVVISDNVTEVLKEYKIVWTVGQDYLNKDFQEKEKVFCTYITPRTKNVSSSQLLIGDLNV